MNPKLNSTYLTIVNRMKAFRPTIDLEKHIGDPDPNVRLYDEKLLVRQQLATYGLAAAPTTLDGITFIPKDWTKLVDALRMATTAEGEQAFAGGNRPEAPRHWALDASMGATVGVGFREIWRPKLSKRGLQMADLPDRRSRGWRDDFGSQFGKDPEPLDISSLHVAVAPDRVNVHIDETGFVFLDGDGDLVVGPNSGHHIVNELIWKSLLDIPAWMAERIDIVSPNSTNNFARAGVSIDLLRRKTFRVTATGTCAIHGGFDCSGTVTISGTHTLFDSK